MLTTQRDLTQTTLAVLFIGLLIAASFWIVWPFLSALIWATMVVVATWPLMLQVQARLGGSRMLAVAVMTLSLLLVLLVPMSLAIVTLVDNADRIIGWSKWLAESRVPAPPHWVAGIPLIGDRIQQFWLQFVASGIQDLAIKLVPYAKDITRWFVAEVGGFGVLFFQFLLTVLIAAILYAGGESAATWVKQFGLRLAGEKGVGAVVLAGQAIRGVALGVVVTALAQSILGGIGLAISGVPMVAVLTALMFMLCIAQLGPVFVLLPAVGWLFWSGDTGWGIFLLVWTLVVGTLDNILRPYLIRKGADLPMLLMFVGVIGGMVSFGLVGIFVGPVVLAVTYTLLDAWVQGDKQPV
ncbi:MAG: AI-2E family transporter YdiK [Thiobacillus sp.]|nr:AI-2E family transporter YdiK [Gammaproteobacteria bacterium]MDP3125990.1 AI-2E family transporter YdiK [Thiobacillus sp.]